MAFLVSKMLKEAQLQESNAWINLGQVIIESNPMIIYVI